MGAAEIACDGWWEEIYYGRQSMHELKLQITGGQIRGSGWDIVGLFTFTGTLTENGDVVMLKQYVGKHQVEYIGRYDGEGTLSGTWRIGGLSDRWAIKFRRAQSAHSDLNDVVELT